jgi:cold shock CspA family protein
MKSNKEGLVYQLGEKKGVVLLAWDDDEETNSDVFYDAEDINDDGNKKLASQNIGSKLKKAPEIMNDVTESSGDSKSDVFYDAEDINDDGNKKLPAQNIGSKLKKVPEIMTDFTERSSEYEDPAVKRWRLEEEMLQNLYKKKLKTKYWVPPRHGFLYYDGSVSRSEFEERKAKKN